MFKRIDSICAKGLKALCYTELTISVLSLVAMVVLNAFEIVRRYFWGLSLVWVQEITVLFMVWFTFMGFSMITYAKKDIYIDFLVEKMPRPAKKTVELLTILASLVFIVLYTYFTWKLFLSQGVQTTIVAKYPMRYRTMAPLINGITLLFIYIGLLKDWILGLGHKKESETEPHTAGGTG